tara:strand:- start:4176 stop:5231 length:1056 start_codon:yes stop_codon:yes gene_type:complete
MSIKNVNKSSNNSSLLSYKSEYVCLFALIISFVIMTIIIGNLKEIPNKLCKYDSSSDNIIITPEQNKNSAEVILTGCLKNGSEIDQDETTRTKRNNVSILLPIFSTISALFFLLIIFGYYQISQDDVSSNSEFYGKLKNILGQNTIVEYLSSAIYWLCDFSNRDIVDYIVHLIVLIIIISPFILLGIVQNELEKNKKKGWDYDLMQLSFNITIFIIFAIYIGMKLKSDSSIIYIILIISVLLCLILCIMSISKIIDLKSGNLTCFSKENVSKDGDTLFIENNCIFKDDQDPYNNGRVVYNIISRVLIVLGSIYILEFLVAQKLSNEKEKLGVRLLNLALTIIYVVFIILYH